MRREIHATITRDNPMRVELYVGAQTMMKLSADEARTFATMLTRLADRIQPKLDFVNGCDFCGHAKCKGCCWKCNRPECEFNVAGECPDCP